MRCALEIARIASGHESSARAPCADPQRRDDRPSLLAAKRQTPVLSIIVQRSKTRQAYVREIYVSAFFWNDQNKQMHFGINCTRIRYESASDNGNAPIVPTGTELLIVFRVLRKMPEISECANPQTA